MNSLAYLPVSSDSCAALLRADWADLGIDWSRFRCAVFRTTWDYFERLPEFSAWLARVEVETHLCNCVETLRWNLDKHYLLDLAARGVAVVPSRFLERGSERIDDRFRSRVVHGEAAIFEVGGDVIFRRNREEDRVVIEGGA